VEHAILHAAVHVHARQHRLHHLDVLGPHALDRHLAAGDGPHHRPAAGLDVVAAQFVLHAAQLGTPSTRRLDDPMPDTPAPIFAGTRTARRRAARSRRGGISVTPSARAAASSAVSVPVTEAS
jgi:hypothetical protein